MTTILVIIIIITTDVLIIKRLTVVGGCIQGSPSICIGNVLRVLHNRNQNPSHIISGDHSLLTWLRTAAASGRHSHTDYANCLAHSSTNPSKSASVGIVPRAAMYMLAASVP